MFGMSMESTILAGLAVQTFIFVVGGYALLIRNDESQKMLARQINSIQEELKDLAKVMTMMAVQTTRLDTLSSRVQTLDQRLDELRHGQGFVVGGRGGTDREY